MKPCVFVGCRQNLYLDVKPRGNIAHPVEPPEAMDPEWSCALDVADRGEQTLEQVSNAFGLTRERVRQIETIALLRALDNATLSMVHHVREDDTVDPGVVGKQRAEGY